MTDESSRSNNLHNDAAIPNFPGAAFDESRANILLDVLHTNNDFVDCGDWLHPEREQMGAGVNIDSVQECTVPEKILLAAYDLEEKGHSPFSAEALVVAAWEKFPKTFGLKGFAERHPDSNKVLSSVMGARGLTSKGWLTKMGQKLYALTRDGKICVRRLLSDGEAITPVEPIKLTQSQEQFVLHLMNSAAIQKFLDGSKNELTFSEAMKFWGLAESVTGANLDARMNDINNSLAEVDRQLTRGDAVLSNGQSLSTGEMETLNAVHKFMREKFSRHLNLLRIRGART